MHTSVMDFIGRAVADLGVAGDDVLDVGALDINGTARSLFTGPYLGVDMQAGASVDAVLNAHDISPALGTFDVIVCAEMLEHDDGPWLSLAAMRGVCRDGGLLILTCRGYDERGSFKLHDYPWDMYRYSVQGIEALLRYTGWRPLSVERDPECPGVFALAAPA